MMDIKNLFSLKGKKAFITGAAQGIGKTLALAFADSGADVAIVDINMDLALATAKETAARGVKSMAIKCDVTKPEEVDQMVAKVVHDFGGLDVAVNNAGIATIIPAEEMSYADWIKVIDVNLNGVFLTAQAAGKVMIKQKHGSIVNTASMSAHIVNIPQTLAHYTTSKAGVLHLTKSLAVEWAKYNVRVNCVSPGYIGTELVRSLTDLVAIWTKMTPAGRIGTPDDLVGAYIYLASDASAWTTGTDIIVDGGYCSL